MKRLAIVVPAVLGGWVAWLLLTLPPTAVALPSTPTPAVVRGAYHVHSVASDGTGTAEQIAAAASRAGLNFVIVTDHGDAFRTPMAPRYFGKVLLIDATEISTSQGHYVAIGLGRPPYRLAGEARDVVEDVARFGGFGVAAHPDSGREALAWAAWDAPVDGIEWLNGDTQWRAMPAWRVFPILVQYAARPAETLVSRFTRPQALLQHWDLLTSQRPVVALAGSDAHARLGLRGKGDPDVERLYLPFPGYQAVFGAFCLNVELDGAPSGDAVADAQAVVSALKRGSVSTVLSGLASPATLSFMAWSSTSTVRQGGRMAIGPGVMLRASANLPPGATIALLKDGRVVQEEHAQTLRYATDRPGVFRVEARLAGADAMPWILSNPIYIGLPGPASSGDDTTAQRAVPYPSAPDWQVEHDPSSSGTVTEPADAGASRETQWRFRLGSGGAGSAFAAMATSVVDALGRADQLRFRIRATRPMRVSVQLRLKNGSGDRRRVRSVYADVASRVVAIPLAEMRVAGTGESVALDRRDIGALLFVIDTVNGQPGDQGTIWIEALATVPEAQVRTVNSK
ncbi:MAG: CehA/McbA family metallohydrolase [Acidobacteriota bacterium]